MSALDTLAGVDRLSSLDTAFLDLEAPRTPMHFASVTYVEGEPLRDAAGRIRLEEIRRLVDDRLSLAPRFRQLVVLPPFGLGRPVWVDDPDFDVANHVFETTLPSPGSEQQLRELCAREMMRALDRSRPLWELWVVDGYEDGSVVLVEKVHHAMMDGVSGVDIALLLTDPARRTEVSPSPAPPGPTPPDRGALLLSGIFDELGVLLAILEAPARALRLATRLLCHPEQASDLAREARAVGQGAVSLLRRETVAPRTPLNEPVGRHRVFAHVEWPMEQLRHVAGQFDCTLNDVVLAAAAGGIRNVLIARGEDPGSRFQVAVPVSIRGPGGHLLLGNQVAAFLVSLPLGIADPGDELERIRRITLARKAEGQWRAVAAAVGSADRLSSQAVSFVARLTRRQRLANAVVTNVPGPPGPRFILGAQMRRMVPVVPLGPNLDLSIAFLSYGDEGSFGCLADGEGAADATKLAEGIASTLEQLSAGGARRVAAAS